MFKDPNGKLSLMRIVVFAVLCLGGVVVGAGVIGWFGHLDGATTIIAVGAGFISLSLGAKAWQASSENSSIAPPTGGASA